ncbi:hypothetical protein [Stappia sp.]|jgi:hypothetical protein|uniref:hypothetical protein n=1 Tax=Stappia sp. TaxID=1870903 RepID=UPI003D0A141D
MRKMTRIALAAAMAATMTTTMITGAFAVEDNMSRQMRLDRLKEQDMRGGPYIRGGHGATLTRYKVCNVMPTPVRDPYTGERVYVMKEVCWME